MTEKAYGGSTGIPSPKPITKTKSNDVQSITKKSTKMTNENSSISQEEIDKLKKAGEIAKQVKEFAKTIIKKDVPLIEIANKIDNKIKELAALPAFPVNLSINEIAAHSTPGPNDETLAHGLLKFDVGIHIDGFVADTAFSIDLEDSQENKKLIEASQEALKSAIDTIQTGTPLNEIGKTIEEAITSKGFHPIINLSGHSLAQYKLHAGITIPNHSNSPSTPIETGAYAIEPFATTGLGQVRDGRPSGIYRIESEGSVRDPFAREVLSYILEEYKTLPFCSRWLHKKFGSRALIALKRIEDAGITHQYPQLIEKSGKPVAQSEHTIILTNKEKIITT